jgi:thiamine pyrophosphate-dependent acetolactate synthase large subunit-like protein
MPLCASPTPALGILARSWRAEDAEAALASTGSPMAPGGAPLMIPAELGVVTDDLDPPVVALSGDNDFQFMIEKLPVGAQFNLPYLHVVANNADLGLIRQSQRALDMGYAVQLSLTTSTQPRPPTRSPRRAD